MNVVSNCLFVATHVQATCLIIVSNIFLTHFRALLKTYHNINLLQIFANFPGVNKFTFFKGINNIRLSLYIRMQMLIFETTIYLLNRRINPTP